MIFLSFLCKIALISVANSFAVYLTEKYCHLPIGEGVVMMGMETRGSHEKSIVGRIGEKVIANGSTISSLEGIEFEIHPKSSQSVIELKTSGFEFKDGSCSGKRKFQKGSIINMSSATTQAIIVIVGAWATSMSSGVKITDDYIFFYDSNSLSEL